MCVAAPARVVSIEGELATLEKNGGERLTVNLMLVDEVPEVGDHVLVHLHYAVRRVPPEEVEETVAMYRKLVEGRTATPCER